MWGEDTGVFSFLDINAQLKQQISPQSGLIVVDK